MLNVVWPYSFERFGSVTIRKQLCRAAIVPFSDEVRHCGVLKCTRELCENEFTIECDPSQRFLTQSLLSEEACDPAEDKDAFIGKNSLVTRKIVLFKSRQFSSEASSEGNCDKDDESFPEPPLSSPLSQIQAETENETCANEFISKFLASQREILSSRRSLTLPNSSTKKKLRKSKSLMLREQRTLSRFEKSRTCTSKPSKTGFSQMHTRV